jgi:ADP-ribosylglycohydrolase
MNKALNNPEAAISSLLLGLATGDALGVPKNPA